MEKIKKLLAGRRFVYYSTTSFMVIAVIGVVFLVYLALKNNDWEIDFTKDGRYSISDETKKYLKSIDKDVKILEMSFKRSPDDEYYKNIIGDFKKASDKIKMENFDAEKNPQMVRKYQIQENELVIIVESGNRFKKIDIGQIFEDYSSKTASLESKLVGAISYVVDKREIKGYFLSGHGELQLQELRSVRDRLQDSQMSLEEIDLTSKTEVPKDASVLIMAGTKTDIADQEKEKIEKYLSNNGKLLVMLSPVFDIKASGLKNVSDILMKYNIGINDDIVFEASPSHAVAGYPTYFRPNLEIVDINSVLIKSKLRVLIPESRSLRNLGQKIDGLTLTSIAKTSVDAWGETNLNDRANKDPKDTKSPMDVIFSAEKTVSGQNPSTSKVVVYGNYINIVDNVFRQLSATGNVELFVSSVKWLSDFQGTSNIAPKTIVEETVTLTFTQAIIILIVVVLLPICFIISGVWVKIARKRL